MICPPCEGIRGQLEDADFFSVTKRLRHIPSKQAQAPGSPGKQGWGYPWGYPGNTITMAFDVDRVLHQSLPGMERPILPKMGSGRLDFEDLAG
jgi:hypothetical protein